MSDVKDFEIENGKLIKYNGNDHNVVIPDTVTGIGHSAFSKNPDLESITIPDSVTFIGYDAFIECRNLKEVILPESLTSIGDEAFRACTSLTGIRIPDQITCINSNTFFSCSRLTDITLPDNLNEIGNGAFQYCSSLTGITIPEKVTSIGNSAFYGCKALSEIVLPVGLTRIGQSAFNDCKSLTIITIPENVTYVNYNAFYGCDALESIVILGNLHNMYSSILGDDHRGHPSIQTISILNKEAWDPRDLKSVLYDAQALKLLILDKDTCITPNLLRQAIRSKVKPAVAVAGGLKTKEHIQSTLTEFDKFQYDPEDLAWTTLYQEGPFWQKWIQQKVGKLKKADSKLYAEYLSGLLNADHSVPEESVRFAEEMLQSCGMTGSQKKAKQTPSNNAEISAEARELLEQVLKQDSADDLAAWGKKRIKQLNKTALVRMSGSEEKAPVESVLFVLKKYMTQMYRLPAYKYSTYKHEIRDLWCSSEADLIAEKLNMSDLLFLCIEPVDAVCRGDADADVSYLIPYCRYTDTAGITRVIDAAEKLVRSKGENERRLSIALRSAILLNNVLPAAQFAEKYDLLSRYANIHHLQEPEVRIRIMADAGNDIRVTQRFDLGDTVIEASLADDLTIRLTDTAKGEEIRTMPRAGKEAFIQYKAELKKYIEQRSALLHSLHMSGEYLDQETWRKGFLEHPAAVRLTQLLVWQDSTGSTFMTVDGKIIQANGGLYNPVGSIRVAHVLDMPEDDIKAWRKWLADNNRKQLFDQVWEPVIPWEKADIKNRYLEAVLSLKVRDMLKKSLLSRGVPFGYKEKKYYWSDEYQGTVSDDPDIMCLGSCAELEYTVDHTNETVTLKEIELSGEPDPREMNAILLELDKATVSSNITRDNDDAVSPQMLSVFTASQITSLLNLAINSKADKCTALLLNYKNEHFPEYADINEFSLDW